MPVASLISSETKTSATNSIFNYKDNNEKLGEVLLLTQLAIQQSATNP